jgi:4-amino-4-deoxy-L-arabinose transferase-like glycosyltransferase
MGSLFPPATLRNRALPQVLRLALLLRNRALPQVLRLALLLRNRALPQVLWVALFALSMLIGLPQRPLTEPDEGRNGEIAREMLASGEYALAQLNHLPNADKPALYPAIVAASYRVLGLSELGARFPSALATLLTAWLTGAFARRLFGPGAGLIAAGALLVAPLTWAYGQIVILDPIFTLWVVAAIMAFHLAVEAALEGRRSRRLALSLLGWACVAVAILTKGPVGLLLPLIVTVPYAAWRRELRAVLDWAGVLLAAAMVTPWVWMISTRLPGFLHYVAVVETWQRVATDTLHRSKPFWYFIPMLLIGAFPWSPVAISAAYRALKARSQHTDPRWVLIGLWILVPLVFFSLSRSKLPHYVLPVMPAFALLAAGLWASPQSQPLPGLRSASWTWVVLGVACALAPVLPAVRNLEEPFRTQAVVLAIVGSCAALAAGLIGLRKRTAGTGAALWIATAPVLLLYLSAQPFLASLSEAFSSRRLADAIRSAQPAGGEVIGAHAYPLALPFYLRRPLDLSSEDGSELTSNYLTLTYSQWLGARSTLHAAGYWQEMLASCPGRTVFVANAWEAPVRMALMAAGLPLLARNASYEIYGPCPHGS